jgi:hypothetical protein
LGIVTEIEALDLEPMASGTLVEQQVVPDGGAW